MTEEDPGVFVNPYTFVPFPGIAEAPGAHRRAPAGHHLLAAGRFAGAVEVELTARSPLLLRGVRPTDQEGDGVGAVHRFPRRVFPGSGEGEEAPFLPGSTLAGVVRSLHETLAGGCLRVFGEDFRPAYRDAVQTRGDRWTLARVEESAPDGRPTALRLCSEVVWVPARHLAAVLGGAAKVRTGATVEVLWSERVSYGRGQGDRQVSREEARERSWVSAGDGWVVLVTDAGARRPGKGYFCAVGKLGEAGDASGASGASGAGLPVSDAAWTDYLTALAGANDVREDRGPKETERREAEETQVFYRQRDEARQSLIGYRHRAYPKLFPGQVVWARRGAGEVDGLALSAVWRHAADTETAGERVPQELLSCQDAADLCPSCRLFGSAETVVVTGDDAAGDGAARADAVSRQLAYRGHLRFSDARPVGTPAVRREELAPLGAPRPGAGQFYLEQRRKSPRPHRPALREWGSDADEPGQPRRLRGRKQYWLTARAAERPLFRVRERSWPGNKMASVAESVEAGARFTFTVRFSGLDLAELGSVLAALDPSLLLGEGTGYAVGGGRPFGFGSCTGRVTAVEVHDAASRYVGGPAPEVSVEGAVAAFRDAADLGVRATWPAVTAALSLDRVEPGTVWYPPKRPLPAQGALTTEDLEAGFGFWKRSSGYRAKNTAFPLIPLPKVTDPDQTPRAEGGTPPAGPPPAGPKPGGPKPGGPKPPRSARKKGKGGRGR